MVKTRRSLSGSSACQETVICWLAARGRVWVGVPAEVDGPVSPLSLTVTLNAAVELVAAALAPCDAGADCVITLMLLTTGGEFCGRYARVTLVRIGVAPFVPASSDFHWM